MATILDVSLLQSFDVIFPVLFIFALVYAMLHKFNIGGNSPVIHAIIAVMTAFMAILSRSVVELINFIIPWFAIAIIFFVLVLLIFYIFGASDSDIKQYMANNASVGWVIVGVAIVIIVAGFGNVFGQQLTEAAFQQGGEVNVSSSSVSSGNFEQNISAILFHPKVLGLAILFVIAIFAVALLGQ